MILDTNALSAWADGDPGFAPLLQSATRLVVPAVVLGEYDFGIRQSRHHVRYTAWLEENLRWAECVPVDAGTARCYGVIRLALKRAGTPIPVNDTWVAAVARQLGLTIASQDAHFDAVPDVVRLGW